MSTVTLLAFAASAAMVLSGCTTTAISAGHSNSGPTPADSGGSERYRRRHLPEEPAFLGYHEIKNRQKKRLQPLLKR